MNQIYSIFIMFVFTFLFIDQQLLNSIEQNINIQLLTTLNQKGLLKKFSYFLYLKKQYVNSSIRDYSPYKFSKRFGFSATKHRTTISWLIQNKWCRLHHGNLTFNSFNHIALLYDIVPHPKSKRTLINPIQWKAKDIHNILLLFFIKTEINKQKFVTSIKSDLHLPETLKKYKRALRLSKKFDLKGEKIDKRTRLSVLSVSKIFNCSIGTASSILKTLKEAGLIIVKSHVKAICSCPAKAFRYLEDIPGLFYFKGRVLKREVNEVIISPLPVK